VDLCDLYTAHGLLADHNGDGCIDAVKARIVLRRDALPAEQRAALDIAARLGFETMSLALPVAVVEDESGPWPAQIHPIVIGAAHGTAHALARDGVPPAESLGPGQGLLQLLPATVQRPQGILVAGGDGDGASAAASLLSSRLPYVWHVGTGRSTLADVAADLRAWLAENGVGAASVSVVAAYVQAGRAGIARLDLEIGGLDHGEVGHLAGLLAKAGSDLLPCRQPGLHAVSVTLRGGTVARRVERDIAAAPEPHVRQPIPADGPTRAGARAETLALSSLYELHGGLFEDARGDLQPNRLRARFVLSESSSAAEAAAACDLAARLGLETLGLELPLAVAAGCSGQTERGLVHLLVGAAAASTHLDMQNGLPTLAERLLSTADSRGVVIAGMDDLHRPVLVATGAEHRGTEAALRYLAVRAPYLDRAESGNATLADIECAVRGALAGEGAAGEAAGVWAALDQIATALHGRAVRSLELSALVAGPADGLAACLRERVADVTGAAHVSVQLQDRAAVRAAIDERWQAQWEVDHAWSLINGQLLPALRQRSSPVHVLEIDLRVSEPPDARRSLRSSIEDALVREGLARDRCHVLVRPTYKQGSHWLLEEVLPRLRARADVARLTIRCRRFTAPSGAGWLELPTRWVQELFPVDELLARELDIDTTAIEYDLSDDLTATYEIVAWSADGDPLLRDQYTATFAERPYLSGYPHWGLVHPDTGRMYVRVDGEAVLDERLPTDRERFWDYYQGVILPRVGERIRTLTLDRPAAEAWPFFERFEIDLTISEEDRALGLHEERSSPLESLHEDLYFVTLDYCCAVTLTAQAEAAGQQPYQPPWMAPSDDLHGLPRSSPHGAPGLIVPLVHQALEKGPEARIRLDEPRAPRPSVRWQAVLADGPTMSGSEVVAPLTCPQPRAVAVVVAPGGMRVEQADVLVSCSGAEQRAALAKRLYALGVLHAHRLYTQVPARAGLDRLDVIVVGGETSRRQTFGPASVSEDGDRATPGSALTPAAPLDIGWDTVIGYEKNNLLLQRLDLYPEVRVWQAGSSLHGRRSYAVEVMAPLPGPLWSRAKAGTFKPTLLINARHHANETSSTSGVLRLIALCATDPSVRTYLQRVNLVVIPFENVDGAVLHDDLQREHPAWMLHAGRYNAHGLEFRREYLNDATRYPEARVLPRLYRLWRPDIVTDDHGFPSHEWVQPFGGYANPWFASDWIPRGLIYLYLPYPHGPGFEGHERLALALRRAVVEELNQDEDIHAWNRAWAYRFKKYAHQWMPRQFPAAYYRDVLVHMARITPDAARPWTSWMTGFADVFPAVTAISWITEVADETAQGSYHQLCARAHLLADLATLRLLATSITTVERSADDSGDHVVLSIHRPRPPLPGADTTIEDPDEVSAQE